MLNPFKDLVRRVKNSEETKLASEPWLALTEDWPPYNYADADQTPTGYSTELIALILKRARMQAPISIVPWSEAFLTASKRPNTLLFTVLKRPEREALFDWVGPIAPGSSFLFKLARRADVEVHSITDAMHYQLGVTHEGGYEPIAKKLGFSPGLNLDVSRDDETVWWKLTQRRVDLIIDTELSAAYRARGMGPDNSVVRLTQVTEGLGHFLAVSKGSNPEDLARLQSAFTEVKRSGAADAVYHKYQFGTN
ncbi:MAG: transporter substrate-binding domain-containing protein [Burkholderiaceae bacterium]|jgi:polar amino acid transport system substrate-binding protein